MENDKILGLQGEWRFLSNFWNTNVEYNGIVYKNAESAFQAQKEPERAKEFQNVPPNQAKSLGRTLKLRKDWDNIKVSIMFDIVYAKFSQNPELKNKLLGTDTAEIVEVNNWKDSFWGVYNNYGKNHLRVILMQVRDELK